MKPPLDPAAVLSSVLNSSCSREPWFKTWLEPALYASAGRAEAAPERSRETSEAKRAIVRHDALALHDERPGLTPRWAAIMVAKRVKAGKHEEFKAGGPGVELVRDVVRTVWRK